MGWVISAESFPYALPCWCWKAGRQHSLVAAQQPNRPTAGIYHFRWRASCRSRSPPTHITHNHNTNNYTPPAPLWRDQFHRIAQRAPVPRRCSRGLQTQTVSSHSLTPDPPSLRGVRGPATPRCSRRRRGGSAPLLHPNTANIQEGAHLVLSLSHPGVKCQTLKHVSTVRACYRISE